MSSKNKNAAPNAHNDLQFSECGDDELVDIRNVIINMDLNKADRKNFFCDRSKTHIVINVTGRRSRLVSL